MILPVAGVIAADPAALLAARAPHPDVVAIMDVQLSASRTLSSSARATMIAEATAIWRQAGVQLRWDPAAPPDPPADAALRVFVVARDPARDNPGAEWRAARLTVDHTQRFLAIASIAAAERALEELGVANEPLRLRERRVGLMLGRSVAHELGHFLLGGSHARRGLMRAVIPAQELADLSGAPFALEPAAVERIRTRSVRIAAHGSLSPAFSRQQ
jgi:hypothetical protein